MNNRTLNFNNRTVVITGAGHGIGRAHALLFARLGANVVVNDLGTDVSGQGRTSEAADSVVAEITSKGGRAIANYESVEDGTRIIEHALDHFGRIDVVVNNAGILRDVSFHKMTDTDWDQIYGVHLHGAYKVTRAAWPYMRDQGYGRVIFTASSAGIYGNFGQAHYSTMKLAQHGLAQTLAIEGRSKNINVNTIAPVAGSRMSETVMPTEIVKKLNPDAISPLVCYLAHESCTESGGLFEVGAGWVGKLRWERSKGASFDSDKGHNPADIAEHWDQICDFTGADHPKDVFESFAAIEENIGTTISLQRAR